MAPQQVLLVAQHLRQGRQVLVDQEVDVRLRVPSQPLRLAEILCGLPGSIFEDRHPGMQIVWLTQMLLGPSVSVTAISGQINQGISA